MKNTLYRKLISASLLASLVFCTACNKPDVSEKVRPKHKTALPEVTSAEDSDTARSLRSNELLAYIRNHPDEYPDNLLTLAETYPQTIEYVYNFPRESGYNHVIDLSGEITAGEIPYFSQLDARWGYVPYGNGMIGYTGCGPTCLSMVAVYLTGNPEYSPKYVADFAVDNDYCIPGNGSSWDLMAVGCENFGIYSCEIPAVEEELTLALDSGCPVICIMGPGDFTDEGHFIVITGYTDDGFTVNDPFSEERSAKVWDSNTILSQANCIWAFSLQ